MAYNKEHIITQYKKLKKHLGKSPSSSVFLKETGIHKRHLEKVFGSNSFSKLVNECGDIPQTFSKPKSNLTDILIQWGNLARTLKKLPTTADWSFHNGTPTPDGIARSHKIKWKDLQDKFLEQFSNDNDWSDIVEMIPATLDNGSVIKDEKFIVGTVYLIKSGKFYKIGRSNSTGRRHYELSIQLPESAEVIHSINTDDPVGIEAYWHNRFRDKRKNGEWFELSAEDIKAFKRRKFM